MPGLTQEEIDALDRLTESREMSESQRTAVKALALECLDEEYLPTPRLRHLVHIFRRRKRNLGLDPFTIITIIKVAILFWQLWKKWKASDDTAVKGLLSSIEGEQEDEPEVLGR